MINTNYFRTTCVLLVFLAFLSGCDEYLDQTPDAVIGDADIFGTYESTQGYLDKQYAFIADVLYYRSGGYIAYGDDFVASRGSNSAMAKGDYMFAATPQFWSAFWYKARIFSRFNPATGTTTGLWPSGWIMIRDANLVLKNLRLMTDATQEERDLIKGQALFFRAYHYWNYVRNWGGMPYIDKFLEGNDDPRLPRLNTWQTIELIVKDLDEAMVLLPEDWDNTSRGLEAPGKNLGRITKGACIGLKAKALLYAGSPTFSLESSGVLDYNADYLSRAASAAWELIKLADAGVYNLVPWGPEYYRQFGRNDGFNCWSDETILGPVNWAKGPWIGYGSGMFIQLHGRNVNPMRFGDQDITTCVTQNMVEMFEMENGLPIDDPSSGYDPMDPWNNRDPRFRGNVLVDGDMWTFTDPEANKLDMYVGGKDTGPEFMSPFIFKKFWPKGCNSYDLQWTQFTGMNPNIRLAEVYLVYAEAVNEVWGPGGSVPGASLTASEAVNIVRNRVSMPPVASKFLSSKEAFRERIWNERAVELHGEDGSRWYDLRRWHVAHLDKYKICYKVEFDKDYTYFNKLVTFEKVFDQKHYWLPVPIEATQVYSGFNQNPGW